MRARIVVDTEERLDRVEPKIYGHFIEHLGRCIYGGVWVGEGSEVPHERGFRKDVLEATRRLQPPIMRWPGGNFASAYHWEDGIGPREERPVRLDLAWGAEESNQFGTDEFIEWCQLVGAEPYICVNAGSGTPEEAAHWVEYCNRKGETYYAKLREKFGHPQPYKVRFWGIGNELYGEWQVGHCLDGAECARRTLEFAKLMRRVDPEIELVAVGCEDENWNFEMVRRAGKWFQHLSVHIYIGGSALKTIAELLAAPLHIERTLRRVYGTIQSARSASRIKHPIKIALDEWNVWYPEAKAPEHHQITALKDGLFTASTFNAFHRLGNILSMACFAQLVNVLPLILTRDDGAMFVNPQYLAFLLYVRRTGEFAVYSRAEVDGYKSEVYGFDVPFLDLSATFSPEAGTLFLHLVNRSEREPVLCQVELRNFVPKEGEVAVLTADSPEARNDFDNPDVVRISERSLDNVGKRFEHEIPPHTAEVLTLHG